MTDPKDQPGKSDEPQPNDDQPPRSQERPLAMDALIAASRINRRSVGDDGTPLHIVDVGRICDRIETFLKAQAELPANVRISRSKMARAIGESPSTVSQVLAGKYPKGKREGWRKRDGTLRKLDQFITLQIERANSPERSGFAWTGVAEEINGVAKTVVLLNGIGLVWSPAGCGKSLTAEALLSVYPGSVLITVDDSCSTTPALLRCLVDALKLPCLAVERRSNFNGVVACLQASKRLVMIDEAHLASMDVLNTARQLQDKAKFPLLLLGLPSLAKMLLAGRGDDAKGATLYSRICISRDLTERCRGDGGRGEPLFSVADVKKVFARSKLRIQPDGIQWLHGLANLLDDGGLRACTNAVQLANQVADQKGESTITRELLQQVSRLLHGVQGAQAIGNRIRAARKVG